MNAVVMVGAVLALISSPASVSAAPTAAEIEVLIGGTALVIALNVLLLRRIFGPLERLTDHAPRRPARPGPPRADRQARGGGGGTGARVQRHARPLEAERQGSARRALAAQEGERLRVARELHDEVGQTLTGVVLALEEIHRRAPADLQRSRGGAGGGARRCRAGARDRARAAAGPLEELGLRSALTTLRRPSGTGLRVRHAIGATCRCSARTRTSPSTAWPRSR